MDIDQNATINIQYENSYVAFLDVLGFKNLVFSKRNDDKVKLDQYFGVVNSAIQYLAGIPSKKKIGSIIISDSIILSVPHGQNRNDNLNILRNLCVAVGIVQQYLGLKDIWLRGGISSGETYFDSERGQIVGPANINSYHLENSIAIWPRVVLDSKIIEELNFQSATQFINEINQTDNGGLNYSNWGSSILFSWHYPNKERVGLIDKDVALFIDYLSPLVEDNGHKFRAPDISHI